MHFTMVSKEGGGERMGRGEAFCVVFISMMLWYGVSIVSAFGHVRS